MKTFQDVYKFPLVIDEYGYQYVFDSNNQMVLQFIQEDDILNGELFYIINGGNFGKPIIEFTYRFEDQVIYNGDMEIACIRGYGYLTGSLGLSHEEASDIQDGFAEYVLNKLNSIDNE